MQKSPGFLVTLRRRPEHQRRIVGIALYLVIAGGIVFLWGRSFSRLSLDDSASSDRGTSLLSPFENLRDEFARAGDGFADIARAIPGLFQKVESIDGASAPSETTHLPSAPGIAPVATSTEPTPEPGIAIAPPPAATTPSSSRTANVEPIGITAETVLTAIEAPEVLHLPEPRASARIASILAARSQTSFLDPIRTILLTFIHAR